MNTTGQIRKAMMNGVSSMPMAGYNPQTFQQECRVLNALSTQKQALQIQPQVEQTPEIEEPAMAQPAQAPVSVNLNKSGFSKAGERSHEGQLASMMRSKMFETAALGATAIAAPAALPIAAALSSASFMNDAMRYMIQNPTSYKIQDSNIQRASQAPKTSLSAFNGEALEPKFKYADEETGMTLETSDPRLKKMLTGMQRDNMKVLMALQYNRRQAPANTYKQAPRLAA